MPAGGNAGAEWGGASFPMPAIAGASATRHENTNPPTDVGLNPKN